MSEPLRIRSGTEEDLVRAFGPERLLIGFPVGPEDDETDEQPEHEDVGGRDGDEPVTQ